MCLENSEKSRGARVEGSVWGVYLERPSQRHVKDRVLEGLGSQGAGTSIGKLGLEGVGTCYPWRWASMPKGRHGHHSCSQHSVDTGCAK